MPAATVPVISTMVDGRRAWVIRAKGLRPGDWVMTPHGIDREVVTVAWYEDGSVEAEFDHSGREAKESDMLRRSDESLVFIGPRDA